MAQTIQTNESISTLDVSVVVTFKNTYTHIYKYTHNNSLGVYMSKER